jgi:thioredoxin-related protein
MKTRAAVMGWVGVMLMFGLRAGAAEWETSFASASTNASKAGLYMLLDFSGSDWCGWCVKLDKEVFSKPEFKAFAGKQLVCVLVDFPRQKKQSKKEKDQNAELAKKYGIRGFPTVILLSPEGDLVGRTGYQEGGAVKYVAHLKAMIDTYEKAHPRQAAKPQRPPGSAGTAAGK